MRLATPVFRFGLGLLKNPVHPIRTELVQLLDLLDRDNRAIGFVLLNG